MWIPRSFAYWSALHSGCQLLSALTKLFSQRERRGSIVAWVSEQGKAQVVVRESLHWRVANLWEGKKKSYIFERARRRPRLTSEGKAHIRTKEWRCLRRSEIKSFREQDTFFRMFSLETDKSKDWGLLRDKKQYVWAESSFCGKACNDVVLSHRVVWVKPESLRRLLYHPRPQTPPTTWDL